MYKKFRCKIPMNMQFFGEGGAADGAAEQDGKPGGGAAGGQEKSNPAGVQVDYDKIQQMLNGTLAAKEDTALKAYFKQQGLSQQEVEQAISSFKQKKAESQPDVNAMQNDLNTARAEAQAAKLESAATMAAISIGLDAKTIPYVLKMADMSKVVDKEGKVNEEELKNALNKVLEDVPALKPQAEGLRGFHIGADGNGGKQHEENLDNKNKVPTKRWNRFN